MHTACGMSNVVIELTLAFMNLRLLIALVKALCIFINKAKGLRPTNEQENDIVSRRMFIDIARSQRSKKD